MTGTACHQSHRPGCSASGAGQCSGLVIRTSELSGVCTGPRDHGTWLAWRSQHRAVSVTSARLRPQMDDVTQVHTGTQRPLTHS